MASILVVDDEPDIRYLNQLNLELDGHRVMTAANGVEALAAVRAEVPDLIVCDVMMPDLDGWGVLEQLKSDTDVAISEVPVLMMTALGADEARIRGGIEGAVRYLVKPVTPDQLRDAVRDALEGPPEPVQRRKAQTEALETLARKEGGRSAEDDPRPRLTNLERPKEVPGDEPEPVVDEDRLAQLTDKQMELLQALRGASSVSAAATDLGVSRSNVYASLRRINRKLDIGSVQELLHRLRTGRLLDGD